MISNASKIHSEYVLLLHPEATLKKNARKCFLQEINNRAPDLIYSDEAIVCGEKKRRFNFYKPDFSLDLLTSQPYFGAMLCVKKSFLNEIDIDESLPYLNLFYEISLQAVLAEKNILHIDEVLFTREVNQEKVSDKNFFEEFDQEFGRKSLANYCGKKKILAEVIDGPYHATFDLQRKILGEPLVSIVIPFRDMPELLGVCVNSILEKTHYKNYEIIGMDNGSIQEDTRKLMASLAEKYSRVHFYSFDEPFNYSRINNVAVLQYTKGDQIVFLNNDTEVISSDWIEALLAQSQREEVGVVGAKLLYSDRTIQHAGMVTTFMNHAFRYLPEDAPGYFYFLQLIRNYNVLTFACVMTSRKVFDEIAGLNEDLPVLYSDVYYCLRAIEKGYLNVYTPHAVLFHHESKSRGNNDTLKRKWQVYKDRGVSYRCSKALFDYDQFYNKHLSLVRDDFSEKAAESFKERIKSYCKKWILSAYVPF